MKRLLVAVLVYLVIAGGVGAGYYVNNPYKGNSIAVFEAAGAGLIWPFVVIGVLGKRVGDYYGTVAR